MTAEVYWICAPHHTDMTSDGYIGVSKNAKNRWLYGHNWAHRKGRHENQRFANAISKYGWENLTKKILVIADESYCYELEQKLRPNDNIGWNLTTGGNKPPVSKFRGAEYKSPLKGIPRPTPWLIGGTPPNKGKTATEEARAKMSLSGKGRKQTPEQIAKRVAARRATLLAQGRTH